MEIIENYENYCKDNYDRLVEKRTFYGDFISELFVTIKMDENMLDGKSLKRIKRKTNNY